MVLVVIEGYSFTSTQQYAKIATKTIKHLSFENRSIALECIVIKKEFIGIWKLKELKIITL